MLILFTRYSLCGLNRHMSVTHLSWITVWVLRIIKTMLKSVKNSMLMLNHVLVVNTPCAAHLTVGKGIRG